MTSGQLILLQNNGERVIYEPVDNVLHVGSLDKAANVCLSGLKSLAFTISIDNSGRVSMATCIVYITDC